jgi:ABC-2 type transport system permease protein
MATNKNTRDAVVIASLVVAAAVMIIANVLADRKFTRLDLTSEKRYSVSEPFRNILNRLKDPATITYYSLKQVPTSFESRKRDILDKLQEIKTAANGKIEIEVVDPTENKELREKLQKEGFEHPYQEFNKDQISVSNIYSGIKVTYQDKPTGALPGIPDAEQLENLLGSVLLELTLTKKPVIAIQSPPAPPQPPQFGGQRPQGSGFEWFASGQWEDAKKFDVKSVDITENSPIPADAALLMLIRPKELNARQRYEVVKYLAGGGKVFLLASPFKMVNEFGWRAEKSPTGLEDYLKECGLSFGPDFVADKSNLELPQFDRMSQRIVRLRLPFFAKIKAENIDQTSVLTRYMPGLVMPFPADIKVDDALAQKNGLVPSLLAKTSSQSWTVPYSDSFDPEKQGKYDDDKQQTDGAKNVFVQFEGQFPFPFDGKPVPPWNAATPDKPEEKDKEKKAETASVTKKPGRLLVCSAPDGFNEMYLNSQLGNELRGNIFLILNITTTCGLGDDMANLRVKQYETRAIKSLVGKENDRWRNWLKAGLIAGMPALVIIVALVRTLLRRRTQTRYERTFAQTIGPSSFSP